MNLRSKKVNRSSFALIIVLLLFLFQSYYFVFTTGAGVAPDENYHLSVSTIHNKNPYPFVYNTDESYIYGDLENTPFLYHSINGGLINLNFYKLPLIIYLRLFSPIIGLFSLLTLYKITKLVIQDGLLSVIPGILLTHTLMFTMISGVVSYDNLTILFSLQSIYFLLKFMEKYNLKYFLLLIIFVCLGSLTKASFLPLAVLISLVFLVYTIYTKKYKDLPKFRFEFNKKFNIILFIIASLTLISLVYLYIGNFLKFGNYLPTCDQVLSHDICYNRNGVYNRDYNLINNRPPEFTPQPIYTSFKEWTVLYTKSLFGLLTHKMMFFFKYSLAPFIVVSCLSFIGMLKSKLSYNKYLISTLFIFTGYVFIAFIYNYLDYVEKGKWIATQGRYILPVLPLLYVLIVYYLKQINLSRKYQTALVFILTLSCFLLSFLYYISEKPSIVDLDWDMVSDQNHPYSNFMD
ncbi:MAG: hypothetical protein GF364_09215 [Candidatus Lokiarchaeota archaeon]|nr:hypothetical protein [Candidatus Lokiarchaeota archaeon]